MSNISFCFKNVSSKRLDVIVSSVGFACLMSWVYAPLFFFPIDIPIGNDCAWMYMSGSITALLIILVGGRLVLSAALRRACVLAFALLAAVGLSLRVFIEAQEVGYLLSGIGYAGLFIAWGMHFSCMTVHHAGGGIALGGVVSACICLLIQALPAHAAELIVCFLPLLSVMFYLVAESPVDINRVLKKRVSSADSTGGGNGDVISSSNLNCAGFAPNRVFTAKTDGTKRSKSSLSWKIILAVAIYSMVFEFTLRFTATEGTEGSSLITYTTFLMYFAVFLLISFIEFRGRGFNLTAVYCITVVPMLFSLMLLSVLPEGLLSIPRSVVMLCYVCFGMFAMIMYAHISIRRNVHPSEVFGWGFVAEQLGILLGSAFQILESDLFLQPAFGLGSVTTGALFAALALMVATVFILAGKGEFSERGDSEGDSEKTEVRIVDITALKCVTIAEDYGLSSRETEVLMLLAQGRSNPYIKEALLVSSGTINSHVKSIYTKLSVHSKQELLDLVQEREVDEENSFLS